MLKNVLELLAKEDSEIRIWKHAGVYIVSVEFADYSGGIYESETIGMKNIIKAYEAALKQKQESCSHAIDVVRRCCGKCGFTG